MSQAPASYCRSHSFGWKCIKCSWPAAWLTVTACVLLLLTALSVWYSAAAFSVPFALMGCRKFCILLWLRSLFLTLLEHFDLIVLNAYIICGHKHKASESPDTPSASSWKWWVSVSATVIILRFDFSFWGVLNLLCKYTLWRSSRLSHSCLNQRPFFVFIQSKIKFSPAFSKDKSNNK